MTRDRIKREGLDAINEVRVARGWAPLAELPVGIPLSWDTCVVGRALDLNYETVGCPRTAMLALDVGDGRLARLEAAFEEGRLPELECTDLNGAANLPPLVLADAHDHPLTA